MGTEKETNVQQWTKVQLVYCQVLDKAGPQPVIQEFLLEGQKAPNRGAFEKQKKSDVS